MVINFKVICESPSDSVRNNGGDFSDFFRARARSNSSLAVDIAAAQKAAKNVSRRRTYSDYYSMEDVSPPVSASVVGRSF